MVASVFTHDRGAAGRRQVLLHVLPVAGSDKVWYLNAARAGLLHGVWEPPQRVQPRHDRTARLARTGPQRHHFHPSWWPRVAWGTAINRIGNPANGLTPFQSFWRSSLIIIAICPYVTRSRGGKCGRRYSVSS